jgi:replication factor C subunit 3/5
MDTLPWIEKYRPQKVERIISHDKIVECLQIYIRERAMPNLLIYGPPGTGKTSSIVACAKEMYGKSYPYMVIQLNASDDRGIDVVRKKIKQFVMGKGIFYQGGTDMFKLIILDEIDAMTQDAQAILRKVIETYTPSTRFCLICNYIDSINVSLQSRTTAIRFPPLKGEAIYDRVVEIAEEEGINISKEGIQTIIYKSNGDMRKVLNSLQTVSMAYKEIGEEEVNTFLGYPGSDVIDDIYKRLNKDRYVDVYTFIKNYTKTNGISVTDIITELHVTLHQKLMENPTPKLCRVVQSMAEVEKNQTANTDEQIQIVALIGAFKTA